jgi:hypothetical protein
METKNWGWVDNGSEGGWKLWVPVTARRAITVALEGIFVGGDVNV